MSPYLEIGSCKCHLFKIRSHGITRRMGSNPAGLLSFYGENALGRPQDTQREGSRLKTEASCHKPGKAWSFQRSKQGSSPGGCGEAGPSQHPDFRLPASRSVSEHTSSLLSYLSLRSLLRAARGDDTFKELGLHCSGKRYGR